MGKDKKAQRTKGNVKPSSSGRSAELLGGVASFVGFSSLTDLGYVPAATQSTVDDDSQISAEFRVTLRKMSKKDSVTKIKALQEFENLCATEDVESIKTAIPYWPRLYSKLSIDCDRRVRESTMSAHTALVSQIGKQLAPYLRSVMPSWLLAMTDPHTPAAIGATKSFQSAFSEEKRPGVMIFCSKEIIDTIFDNLFIQSSQTMSDPKTTAKEDQDSKYLRVLYCSLKGLCLLLETTSKLNDKKMEIVNKILPFFKEEKFWKLAKHESNMVRSAWYDTIKSLFEYDVETLRECLEKLSKLIFSSLDCQEASVLPHIWIAFLHLCVGFPDCWDYCGNAQSVFNRIFSVLRDGGRGFMSDIAPQLLPILSVLPLTSMTNPTEFYIDFFRAISTSLRKEKVILVKREASAIVIAQNECLKYMSKQHGENQELWDTLMKYQVFGLIMSSFGENPQLVDCHLYHEVSKLLYYWANTRNSEGKAMNIDKFKKFWSLCLPEFEVWIQDGSEDKIEQLKYFFSVIRDPYSSVARKAKGVRFSEDKSFESLKTTSETSSSVEKETFYKHLSTHVSPTIICCFKTCKEKRKGYVYSLFANLLFNYSSEDIYKELITEKDLDNHKNKIVFLKEFILPLMEELDDIKSSQETLEEKLIQIDISLKLFMFVYSQLKEEEQKETLMNLKPTLKSYALKGIVIEMAERSESDAIASLWLKSPILGSHLIQCLQSLCAITLAKGSLESSSIKAQYNCLKALMNFVFSNGNKEHVIFSLEYQSQMLKILKTIFHQVYSKMSSEENSNNSCSKDCLLLLVSLVNHLLNSSIYSKVDGLEEILKQFYHMLMNSCTERQEKEIVTAVKECFMRGFELNLKSEMSENIEESFSENNSLLVYIIDETKSLIMNDTCSFEKAIELASLVENILVIIYKCTPVVEDCCLLLDHSVMQPTLDKLLPTDLEWSQLEAKLSSLYVAPSVLFGTFICREFPLLLDTKVTPEWHQGYVRMSLFVVKILLSLCKNPATTGEASYSQEDGSLSLGRFTSLLVLALHGLCHLSAVAQINNSLNNNSVPVDVKRGLEELSTSMESLLSLVNEGNKKLVVKNIRDRCLYSNIFWCVTMGQVVNTWLKVPINAYKLISEIDENYLGSTETKQVLIPYLSKENVINILMEESQKLSSLSEDPFSALPSVCLITSALECLPVTQREFKDSEEYQSVESVIHSTFITLVKWRDDASNIFLFASDLSNLPWEDVSLMVSIIRLLTVIVEQHSIHLLHGHWDVTLCALSAWVQSLLEVVQFPESNAIVAMFATACCKCAGVVSELLLHLKKDSSASSLREEYPPTLIEEWQEFFAPSIFNTLIQKFVECSRIYEKERSVILYSLTRSLGESVSNLENCIIREINLPPLFRVEDEENPFSLPDNLQIFLNHLSPLLLSNHPEGQCAAFSVINVMLPEIMSAWEKNSSDVDKEDELPQRYLPHPIISVIKEAHSVVETALIEEDIGNVCEIVPHTDIYTYTNGYLLAWMLTLTAMTHGNENNQQLYASYIRESNLLYSLLNNLFKLMPDKPSLSDSRKNKSDVNMFHTPLTISACSGVSSEFISWLACRIYLSCLSQLPAAVRNWFTNLDRKTQQVVDKYTSSHVSPILIANEISTINDCQAKFDNMTVKSRPGPREIIATYTIDEASMELVLRMGPNYPLSTVTLEDHKRVKVPIAQWRNWLFGLNLMLSHRNTPLLNSLEFWKKNVDQMFEGVEECLICYYILHGTSHEIPSLSCRTCKNKFHPACLYKWFSTSNNSTCPICRSLF